MIYILKSIFNDTLQRNDRFSRTSLTMFSAWFVVLGMAIIDFFKHGLNFEVWVTLVTVALGAKLTDSVSKKIHNDSKV